MLSTGVVNMLC